MEEEHQVPTLEVEPQVQFLGAPIPRRLAYVVAGGTVLLLFLWGNGVPATVLAEFVFPVLFLGGAGYCLVHPERLALDRWAGVLWEYLLLPSRLAWEPAEEALEEPRRGGVSPDFWR